MYLSYFCGSKYAGIELCVSNCGTICDCGNLYFSMLPWLYDHFICVMFMQTDQSLKRLWWWRVSTEKTMMMMSQYWKDYDDDGSVLKRLWWWQVNIENTTMMTGQYCKGFDVDGSLKRLWWQHISIEKAIRFSALTWLLWHHELEGYKSTPWGRRFRHTPSAETMASETMASTETMGSTKVGEKEIERVQQLPFTKWSK
jgi:hypothetical protein